MKSIARPLRVPCGGCKKTGGPAGFAGFLSSPGFSFWLRRAILGKITPTGREDEKMKEKKHRYFPPTIKRVGVLTAGRRSSSRRWAGQSV